MEKPSLDQLRIERKPENETSSWRWPVILILAAIIAAAAWFFWSNRAVSVEVRTAAVRELKSQAAGTVLNASGYVTARRQATVSSKFTGKVMEVLIEEGMTVEAGQVLARLDDSNITASFELAKAQLVSAQKGLKETETLLNEAQINYERSRNLVEK